MTLSEEEEEAEFNPGWFAEDIVSRSYEYADDDFAAAASNQDPADSYEDVAMYENDENYEYGAEGDDLEPYGDDMAESREYV